MIDSLAYIRTGYQPSGIIHVFGSWYSICYLIGIEWKDGPGVRRVETWCRYQLPATKRNARKIVTSHVCHHILPIVTEQDGIVTRHYTVWSWIQTVFIPYAV